MKVQSKKQLPQRIGALLLAVLLMVTSVSVTAPQQAQAANNINQYELVDNVQDAAILHCWNWSYKTIENNLELIAQCGYSAIQTSPATQPKDYAYEGVVGTDVGTPGEGGTGNWWKLYQPVAFSVCDNGQTWLGTKEDLESLCTKAEAYGIKVIVDVVANHMGNIKGWQNSLTDISPQVGEYWNQDMMTDESYWHINDYQVWMSDSRLHFTQGTMGMPDLNTADKRVQTMVANYLDELIDCGVDGFRFDAAKHIETPDDDPSFASDFWPTVLNEAKSHYKEKTGGDLYVYGEVLNTVGDNFSIDSYTKYMSVTDNSAGNHLLEAFRNNNVNTLSMDYAPEVSVLWAESHDTYMNESSRYASDKSIVRTWAMVANKDNAAGLFFVRPYASADILENDCDGAMKGNLQQTLTQATMGECETYVWASKEVAAINHFNNRMVNESDQMGCENNMAYCVRGNGMVIANFNGSGDISISAHGMADGEYTDEVSGNTFRVSGGVLTGKIDSEYGIAVVYQNVMNNPQTEYPVQIKNSVADGTTFYGDSLQVKVSAEYANTASYETSNGESGILSGETTLNIGTGLNKGDSVTLTITGTNKCGTVTKTYTYYKDEYDLTNCIFFENTKGWDTVTAYAWNDEGATTVNNAGWPGEKMFECDTQNHIYALQIDTEAGYNHVIFSNSGASQTADLAMGEVGYMYHPDTNEWTLYREDEESEKTPVITASANSGNFTGSKEVTFTVENAKKATITVNGVAEEFTDSITKTFTDNTEVTVTAVNETKSATKNYTYTRVYEVPTVTVSPKNGTTFTDTIEVTVTASNAEEAYYQIGDSEPVAFSDSKSFTIGADMEPGDTVEVTVTAANTDGSAEPVTAVYTKEEEKEGYNLYLNVENCSWFENDSAVAAIQVDSDSEYTKMNTFTNANGEKLYYYEVPADAKQVSIARMLPSGKCYNEKTIALKDGNDYLVADSNWSSVTAEKYAGSLPGEIVYQTPTITASPAGGCYTGEVEVTLAVKNAQSAAYQLGDGSKVTFTGTAKVTVAETATLKVIAENGDKEVTESYNFVIKEAQTETATVYFTNSNNWGTVYAYSWGGSAKTTAWPGEKMTYVGLNEFNQKVYKAEIAKDVKGLIFNNGSGAQTVDITSGIQDGQGYYISGTSGAKCSVGTYVYGK